MKFTRTLSLAVAAAAALSFTACDSTDSDTNPPVEAVTFNLGNQKSGSTSASAFSARLMQQFSLTYLKDTDSSKWAMVDVVILTQYSTGDSLTFFSPNVVSDLTPTSLGRNTSPYMTAAGKAVTTKFVDLSDMTQEDFTDLKNADDVKEVLDGVSWTRSSIAVKKNQRIGLKLVDGSFAIVNVTASEGPYWNGANAAADDQTKGYYGYNVQVRLAK